MSEGRDQGDVARRLHDLVRQGRSWSGYERNCAFLNTGGTRFANVSGISGLDFPDDARGVSLVDWDHDGDLDLWVVNRNGPQLRLLRNDVPENNHWLAINLQGTSSNRDAIGARVVVEITRGKSRKSNDLASASSADTMRPLRLMRTIRAGEGFLAQSSKWLHFGLGKHANVERIVVHWPGSTTEEFSFSGMPVDAHYQIIEGSGDIGRWDRFDPPANVESALQPSRITGVPPSPVSQSFFAQPLPFPDLSYRTFSGDAQSVTTDSTSCVLINLWATWCQPCLHELSNFANHVNQLRAGGVKVVALSVDGVDPKSTNDGDPAAIIAQLKIPFSTGRATSQLVDLLQLAQDELFDPIRPVSLPGSFLFDRNGQLVAIYKGPVSVESLIDDVKSLELEESTRRMRAIPFTGRWFKQPLRYRLLKMAAELVDTGYVDEAIRYAGRNIDRIQDDPSYPRFLARAGGELRKQKRYDEALDHLQRAIELDNNIRRAHFQLGLTWDELDKLPAARQHYQQELKIDPDFPEAHLRLGMILVRQSKFSAALPHFRDLVRLDPESATARQNLASVLVRLGQVDEARQHYETAIRLDPEFINARVHLAQLLQADGEWATAIELLKEVVRRKPGAVESHFYLAQTMQLAGDAHGAIRHYRRAIEIRPDAAGALNNLAWLLATSAEDDVRAPAAALKLAKQLCEHTHNRSAKALDTLAVALAANGDFEPAVVASRKAIQLARSSEQTEMANAMESRLRLFEQGKSFRENPAEVQ